MCTGYVSQRSKFLEGYEPKIRGEIVSARINWYVAVDTVQ
jgi:hypothetical protein